MPMKTPPEKQSTVVSPGSLNSGPHTCNGVFS